MQRDYTESMYETMVEQINKINDEEWCFVTDLLGDGALYVGSALGIVDSQRYTNDIRSYHEMVLDQHNTTVDKLENIFVDVDNVDIEHGEITCSAYNTMLLCDEVIKELVRIVDPNKLCFDAKVIAMKHNEYATKIAKAKEGLSQAYDKAISNKENMLAKQAAMGFVEGLFSIAISACSLVIGCGTGNVVQVVTSGWDIIDGFFGIMQDTVALGTYGAGKIAGCFGNRELRLKLLEETQDFAGRDGLAGEFEAAGWEELAIATDTADVIFDIVGIVDGFSGKATGREYKLKEGFEKIDAIKDIQKEYKTAKQFKLGYELIKGSFENNIGEVIVDEVIDRYDINKKGLENIDYIDTTIKIKKVADKTGDYIASWFE